MDFMNEFEDELFDEYGNTLIYDTMRRPQKSGKSSSHEEPLDPSKEAFLKKTTKELVTPQCYGCTKTLASHEHVHHHLIHKHHIMMNAIISCLV